MLARTGKVICPFSLLRRYVQAANIDPSSNLKVFRTLQFSRSKSSYTLRSSGISYTRAREVVLGVFFLLGHPAKLLGLHSLRSSGATAAANAGVSDRLFKRHGRWRFRQSQGRLCQEQSRCFTVSFQNLRALNLGPC